PSDWTRSIILPLHKKGSTKQCDNYRTLALISHASKILLYILNNRIRYYLDEQIPQEQAGFVKGRGTREQILNVRQLIEKGREYNVPFIMCFIDYSKAFDCVNWSSLWKVLNVLGVPNHLIVLVQSLYIYSQGVVRIDEAVSQPFCFGKGVRQGCILSPILFDAYGEYIL
ncbi:reverse transcriptase family protein, partial [Pseudomonas aeruginosa]